MKSCPVVHFEIGCDKPESTLRFYTEIFGWQASKGKHSTNLNTGSPEGINGHLTSLGHEPRQYIQFYIKVEAIGRYIKLIEAGGGKLHIGPLPTGEGEYFAWIKDPEGNMVGLLSDNE